MQVILQVLADVRRIDLTRDACSLKLRSRPDAGQQQQVWRPNGTTAQHDLLCGEGGTGFTTANAIFDASGNPLTHGALKLHPARRTATWNGNVVPLTNKEFWLLETLVRKKDQVSTRARLEEALYGWGEEIDSNAVEVYIHYLRRKFHPELIKTIRGVGYTLRRD